MAAVPFAAQALVSTISPLVIETASTQLITLKALIEDFLWQLPEAKDMIVNVMQSSANIFVVHCSSGRYTVILLNTGLTFRSYPVFFAPAPNTQWVKLTRVVYGTTETQSSSAWQSMELL